MNKYHTLTPEMLHIIRDQGTEPAFSGCFLEPLRAGSYLCRGCGAALFRIEHQFLSHCGWPSFDNAIEHAITERPDKDGRRTEIICAYCQAHLGHVFRGEHLTENNLRHCVNSLAIEWTADKTVTQTEEAIFAAGCFWGVEHLFLQKPGVLITEVGYTGGHLDHPNYDAVCSGTTGHYEAMRLVYNPEEISYQELVQYFFEIHDPTQTDGQGPDHGSQYRSAIFYLTAEQKKIAEQVLAALTEKAATAILSASTFWPAEEYHQKYYEKTGGAPYCHRWVKKF